MLIAFEGNEGSGKSTAINAVKDIFEQHGNKVLVTREPGGCELGELVRDTVLHKELNMSHEAIACLMTAARIEHNNKVIKPALESDKVVLVDRYIGSTIAYQMVGGSGDAEFINRLVYNDLIEYPDYTFLLDCPVEEGFRRIGKSNRELDTIEKNSKEFFERVDKGFKEQARLIGGWITIDATISKEETIKQIKKFLNDNVFIHGRG